MLTSKRLNDTDLRLLHIFRTVVDCGGFSAAEAELNISRSAISQHMADLEARLGFTLCKRGRAGFRLTEQGKGVYAAHLQLMGAVENFRGKVSALRHHLRGDLNIGITDNLVTFPRMRVTRALRALKLKGPEVRVNIRMSSPNEIERGVLDDQLHVGITPTNRLLPGIKALPLYGEVSHLYCATDHPFFDRPDVDLDEAVIAEADAVMPSGLAASPYAGLTLRVTATAADREGVAFLILTGCYIGYLPNHYARQWQELGRMRAIRPETYEQRVDYQAITQRGRKTGLILATFMELITAAEEAPSGTARSLA